MQAQSLLVDTSPFLARQWHPTKNTLDLTKIGPKSNKKAWWVCESGHEWEAVIAARGNGNGCPFCSGHRRLEIEGSIRALVKLGEVC